MATISRQVPAHAASVCHPKVKTPRLSTDSVAQRVDRVRPRRGDRLARVHRLQRRAVHQPRVRLVLGQDVQAAIAVVRESQTHRAAGGHRVDRRLRRDRLEVALTVRVRVERLRVVVAVRGRLHRVVAEATTRERGPDRALVPAAAGRRARDDRVARDHQAGTTALQLQAVDHVLQRAVVAARIPGPVEVRVEPVLVDQVPRHVPQRRGPAVAEAVRQRQRRAVQPARWLDRVVRERLLLHVARVRARTQAVARAVGLVERVRHQAARALGLVQARVEQERVGRGSRSSPRPPARCRSGSSASSGRPSGGARRHGRTRGR